MIRSPQSCRGLPRSQHEASDFSLRSTFLRALGFCVAHRHFVESCRGPIRSANFATLSANLLSPCDALLRQDARYPSHASESANASKTFYESILIRRMWRLPHIVAQTGRFTSIRILGCPFLIRSDVDAAARVRLAAAGASPATAKKTLRRRTTRSDLRPFRRPKSSKPNHWPLQ